VSKEIAIIDRSGVKGAQLQITQFAGRAGGGLILQLTQGWGLEPDEPGFIPLTRKDVEELIPILLQWLNMTDPPRSSFERALGKPWSQRSMYSSMKS
jgi:hypothetical protein